jgi:hypothetical protein
MTQKFVSYRIRFLRHKIIIFHDTLYIQRYGLSLPQVFDGHYSPNEYRNLKYSGTDVIVVPIPSEMVQMYYSLGVPRWRRCAVMKHIPAGYLGVWIKDICVHVRPLASESLPLPSVTLGAHPRTGLKPTS